MKKQKFILFVMFIYFFQKANCIYNEIGTQENKDGP